MRKELVDFIGSMNEDEQRELIALYLIGGVDLGEAAHRGPWTAAFLIVTPNAAGQLEPDIGDLRIFPRGRPPLTGRRVLERAAAGLPTRYWIIGSRIC